MIREGEYYDKVGSGHVKCGLCPHYCRLSKGQYGFCKVRFNDDGVLKTINYGELSSLSMDPIEKKPLYHFRPGTRILSVGTIGCNFACDFCQNHSIAKDMDVDTRYMEAKDLAKVAAQMEDNTGIAFTYNEPFIWYEYVKEVSRELKNLDPSKAVVLVTNGFVNKGPLEEILPYVDAMNIDLKSNSQDYYRKICKGGRDEVMETIRIASKHCHVEVTTLMVNGLNDSDEEIGEIASFISQIDKNMVLHLSRYFPAYKMKVPPTPIERIQSGREAARKYLHNVYMGNVNDVDNNTYCAQCGELIIERDYYYSTIVQNGKLCTNCSLEIPIVY